MKTEAGRRLYSIGELYWIFYRAMRTVRSMSRARKNGALSPEFTERIMLAVTEVNGCAICSYAHTKMALEAGMSSEEIRNMLAGSLIGVPAEELPAILFAQHYAEYRGNPSTEAWQRVIETYGESNAHGILGAIRIIMVGNAYGIPWSSFWNRLKGKPDKRSSLIYELGVMTLGTLLALLAMLHALLSALFHVSRVF